MAPAVHTEDHTHLPREVWWSVFHVHSSHSKETSCGQRADGFCHRQTETEATNHIETEKEIPRTRWALWNVAICMMCEEQKQLQVNWFNVFGEIERRCWVACWEGASNSCTAGGQEEVTSAGHSCLSPWNDISSCVSLLPDTSAQWVVWLRALILKRFQKFPY